MSNTSSYHKEWYQNNKDRLKIKRNEKFRCDVCGGYYTMVNKSHHIKSNKHIQQEQALERENILKKQIEQLKKLTQSKSH